MAHGHAPRDAGVSSLLAANESLRKDLLSKDSELVKLRKLLDERDRKLDDAVSFRATATRELDQLGRELQRAQKEVSILRADKASTDAVHAENASYIKKLEARLTAGGKDFLLDQNLKLKASIDKLTADNEQLAASNAGQKAELERAMREIEVLVRAEGARGRTAAHSTTIASLCSMPSRIYHSYSCLLVSRVGICRLRPWSCAQRSCSCMATCVQVCSMKSQIDGKRRAASAPSSAQHATALQRWNSSRAKPRFGRSVRRATLLGRELGRPVWTAASRRWRRLCRPCRRCVEQSSADDDDRLPDTQPLRASASL